MATESHVSLRLDPGIIEEIDKRAEAQEITRSKWIKNVVIEALAQQPDPDGPQSTKEKLQDLTNCEHPKESIRERLFGSMTVSYCLNCGNRLG